MYDRAVLLGVVVSILFGELTGLSPAGLIVSGYVALTLHSPLRVAYTLGVALLAMLAARLLGRVTILYGRRRFAAVILLSFAIDFALRRLGALPFSADMIGYVVPGIIAREFERQGVVKTLLALGIVTGILVLLFLLAGWPVPGL